MLVCAVGCRPWLGPLEHFDLLAGVQRDDGAADVGAASGDKPASHALAAALHRVHAVHAHTPDLLDGAADLRLRRVAPHEERVLALFGSGVALLGDYRRADDVARVAHDCSPSFDWNWSSEARVKMTVSASSTS